MTRTLEDLAARAHTVEPALRIPIVVVTAGESWWWKEGIPEAWSRSHAEIAAAAPGRLALVAEGSRHYVAADRLDVVVDAILRAWRFATEPGTEPGTSGCYVSRISTPSRIFDFTIRTVSSSSLTEAVGVRSRAAASALPQDLLLPSRQRITSGHPSGDLAATQPPAISVTLRPRVLVGRPDSRIGSRAWYALRGPTPIRLQAVARPRSRNAAVHAPRAVVLLPARKLSRPPGRGA
jgi:hypothetical protein